MAGERIPEPAITPESTNGRKRFPRLQFSLSTAVWLVLGIGSAIGLYRNWNAWVPSSISCESGMLETVYAPNGRFVAVKCLDHKIRVLEVASGKTLTVLDSPQAESTNIFFSADGRQLMLYDYGKNIEVRETATGGSLATLDTSDGENNHDVQQIFMSPDGQYVFSQSSIDGVCGWSMKDGKKIFRFDETTPRDMPGFGEGDAYLAAVERAKRSQEAALAANDLNVFYKNMNESGSGVNTGISPDGRLLMTHLIGTREVQLWNTTTQKKLQTLKLPSNVDYISSHVFSSDGRFLVLQATLLAQLQATQGVDADIWDTVTGQHLAALQHHGELFSSAEFSADGRYFIWKPSSFLRMNPSDFQSRLNLPEQLKQKMSEYMQTALISGEKRLCIWDTQDWHEQKCDIGNREITSLSPDGSRQVIIDPNRRVTVLDTRSGQTLFCPPKVEDADINHVVFSPVMDQFVTNGPEDSLVFWSRTRPEPWWGLAWVPYSWLTLITAALLVRSIWITNRTKVGRRAL